MFRSKLNPSSRNVDVLRKAFHIWRIQNAANKEKLVKLNLKR